MDRTTLEKIKSQRQGVIGVRKNQSCDHWEIMVCCSSGCVSGKSEKTIDAFKLACDKNRLKNVQVGKTGCFGLCAFGPIVVVNPGDVFYSNVTPEKAKQIVERHIIGGEVCEEYLLKEDNIPKVKKDQLDFYKYQHMIALKDGDLIDPENIEDYIAIGGFFALDKVLTNMTPKEVVEEIKTSGLRGRGGAGFPTGKKWELAMSNVSDKKYVFCNCDEGDPGAFMDRSIVERNPFALIEAMTIAGYAIGANQGFVYIRAEYALAHKRLQKAIVTAKKYGLLGKNILGGDHNFNLDIKIGAGAFVCGEETALLNSAEGKRGEPHTRPPYPAQSGYDNSPTLLNNVETYVNIPYIILNGGKEYAKIGTETSKGTKVFALTGKINHTGLIELPMGTTIRDIVYKIGGGVPNGKGFKAVQMGGPSGGCVPKEYIDTPIDYESLQKLGSMMGSGGMIMLDEDTCMVDLAKFFLSFSVDESCGKCTPCRIGNKRLLEILERICDGKGTMEDLDELESLSQYIKENSLCGLGQSSPNPVLSTLRYYRDEYIEHIKNHNCPAGVCKALVKYEIDPSKCVGCSACSRACPVRAISGEIRKPFVIDQDICVKCGKCKETCRFGAVKGGKK